MNRTMTKLGTSNLSGGFVRITAHTAPAGHCHQAGWRLDRMKSTNVASTIAACFPAKPQRMPRPHAVVSLQTQPVNRKPQLVPARRLYRNVHPEVSSQRSRARARAKTVAPTTSARTIWRGAVKAPCADRMKMVCLSVRRHPPKTWLSTRVVRILPPAVSSPTLRFNR